MQSVFRAAFSFVQGGGIVVASRPLLRSVLSHEFAEVQMAGGSKTWERPPILTLDSWLASCWQEARFSAPGIPLLLSPLQETLLWESVIAEQNPGLFDPRATAHLARQAASDLALWQITTDQEAWEDHQDGRQFLTWRAEVRKRCREKGWITRPDLWRLLPDYFANEFCSKHRVAFAGFDVVPPALAQLRNAFDSAVFASAEVSLEERGTLHISATPESELDFAARWARTQLEQNPHRSIAVFVADLASRRSETEHRFKRVFYPGRAVRFDQFASAELAFHINVPSPLIEEPVIAGALLLLELASPTIRQSSATSILRSPYIAGAHAERSLRAQADLRLRRERQLDSSLRTLLWAARDAPMLLSRLQAVQTLQSDCPAYQEPSAWSRFFADLLNAVAWPGETALTDAEADLVDSWKDALSELGTTNLVRPRLSFEAAVAQLKRVLARSAGIEAGSWFSPIQILDATDASGLRFDRAIVTGLGEATWPPSVPVSPLIPIRLLRQAGVAGAMPASMHQVRLDATTSLFVSAPAVVAVCVERLAPIARRFVESEHQEIDRWNGFTAIESFAPAPLDLVEDTDAPPFVVNGAARGGTRIIKAQSACPFKAWAEVRLRAETPEEACFGFDALERGDFLHKALQLVWGELRTQADLRAASDDELTEVISTAVESAIASRKDDPFFQQVRATERERLQHLIFDWLRQVEAARLIPFSVEALEQQREFVLAGLPLRVRIDRIDKLKNGGLILIDYKSGRQEKKSLDCPRPREPQLLVYAAAQGTGIEGVFFAQLKPREMDFIGKSAAAHIQRRRADADWNDFLQDARDEVERIAADFLQGKAAVDPARGACDYCSTAPFCRIKEHRAAAEACE